MSAKDRILTTAVSRLLAFRSRTGNIERALRGMRGPRAGAPMPNATRVRVAAVQMEFDFVNDSGQYAEYIYALARNAVEQGAQWVVFPEYAWTPLIGMLPNIRDLETRTREQTQGGLQGAAEAGGASLREILSLVAPYVENAFLTTGSAVAKALNIYLMNGSTIARDESGKLYNVAHFFAPDGSHIGEQIKMHAFTSERDWLTVGSKLQTFDVGFTRAAMPVCMDFTYWETTRLAFQHGTEILFNPSADDAAESEYAQARGVRTRVQEVPCYGILANIVTDLFGLHWRGPSLIVQPCALGPSILAQTRYADRADVIVTQLDLERLRAYRAELHWDTNATLMQSILPRAYRDWGKRSR